MFVLWNLEYNVNKFNRNVDIYFATQFLGSYPTWKYGESAFLGMRQEVKQSKVFWIKKDLVSINPMPMNLNKPQFPYTTHISTFHFQKRQ